MEFKRSRVRPRLLGAVAASWLLMASLGCQRPAPVRPLVAANQVRLSGAFMAGGGVFPGTRWARSEDAQPYFASWSSVPASAHLTTNEFIAPADLSLFLAGQPLADGNSLYLLQGGTTRLNLRAIADPGLEWTHSTWKVPGVWRGKPVRLVAEHRASAPWFGITLPAAAAPAGLAELAKRITLLVLTVAASGALFLLPGTAIAACLCFRKQLDATTFACVALLGSGATGYAAFLAYWLSPRSGKAFSCIALLCSVGVLAYTFGLHRVPARLVRQLAIAAGLAALVAIFYSGLTWMYPYSEQPLTEAAHRYYDLPFDNGLPYLFADHLLRHLPVKPYLIFGWQSSDRPPLQTGIVLLQFPLWNASAREWWYQGLATFLQATWISAIWLFMRAANFPRRIIGVVLGFCLVSPFFLLHTMFVWPKLLSAAFFLIGLTLLRFAIPGAKPDRFAVALSAAAMSLALLSHAGIAFSVIALCLLLAATRSLPPLKTAVPGALVALVFLLPWALYQKLYDPPGNRLLKWHLAGAVDLDSRSFGRAFVDAYARTPLSTILHNRIANLGMLVGDEPLRQLAGIMRGHSRPNLQAWVATYINGVFFHVFQTLGVLDIGLLAFLFARFASRKHADCLGAIVERLLLLASISILIWCGLIAIPAGTLVHAGSFGDMTLLFVACAASLAHLAPRLSSALFVFQALFAFPLFVFAARLLRSAPDAVWTGSFDPGMAALSLAAVVALGALACRFVYASPPGAAVDAMPGDACAVSSNASGLR